MSFHDKSAIPADREAALLTEIKDWQQKWRDECRMREKVSAEFIAAQKHWELSNEELRLKHDNELSLLRQQVYILEAKVSYV